MLLLAGAARVEGAGGAAPVGRGEDLKVILLTMGPGDDVYEKFGHNAIWIRDSAAGTDHVFNYGLFDLGEAGFIRKFLEGRMMYWMGGEDFHQYTWPTYTRLLNRSIV